MNFPKIRNVVVQNQFLSFSKKIQSFPRNSPTVQNAVDIQQRLSSTYSIGSGQKEQTLIQKVIKKIPFLNVDRVRIKGAGYLLYENIADKIDYFDFFEKLDLPDTFYSWFAVTEMHIWMLSARSMADESEGQILRNSLLEAMWSDVAKRVKKLGAANPAATRAQVQELSEQLQAAFIAYDEGIQSDDIVLAGAIWRRMYQMDYASPHSIEMIVRYIRKHMVLLDNLSKEQMLDIEAVKWSPLT